VDMSGRLQDRLVCLPVNAASGSLKDDVYVNNPRAFTQWKQNIREEISAILLEVTRRIMNSQSTVQ
jgi:hypothetical protein